MKPKAAPLATSIATATGGSPVRLLPLFPAATSALFALQHQAEAAIVYSGPNQDVTITAATANAGAGYVNLFAGAGMAINVSGYLKSNVVHRIRGASFQVSNSGALELNGSGALKKLAAGAAISAAKVAGFYQGPIVRFNNGNLAAGTWAAGQLGFAGFVLDNGDLGWIRLEWTGSGNGSLSFTAIDWAYDTKPGETILAGQTTAAPEPGAAALLALAGAGAAFLRRKREA